MVFLFQRDGDYSVRSPPGPSSLALLKRRITNTWLTILKLKKKRTPCQVRVTLLFLQTFVPPFAPFFLLMTRDDMYRITTFRYRDTLFFRRFRKTAIKKASSCMSVGLSDCLPVRPSFRLFFPTEKLGFHWKDCHCIWRFSVFRECIEET